MFVSDAQLATWMPKRYWTDFVIGGISGGQGNRPKHKMTTSILLMMIGCLKLDCVCHIRLLKQLLLVQKTSR